MMRESGSISLPLPGRISSPCLPTAHSMNSPELASGSSSPVAEAFCSAGSVSSCSRRAMAWCVIRRPSVEPGRISMARTQRGSVSPVSATGFHQASFASAGIV